MANPQRPLDPVYLQPRVLLTWVVTAAWAGTISLLSTQFFSSSVTSGLLAQLFLAFHIHFSPQTFEIVHLLIRKLAHGCEYAIFALLLYYSFTPRHPESWNARSALGALVLSGLYSLLDEYHQSFVPGRTASLADSGLDTLGALLGLVFLYAVTRLQDSSSRQAATIESKAEMKNGADGE